MTLDYTVHVQARIAILGYIEEIITTFDKTDPKGKVTKSSTALKNIFVVNKDCKKLDQEKVVKFHNIVAKNLYATKRARTDTYTVIEFITTRVRSPKEENWYKLLYMMRYLRGTSKLSPTLSAYGSEILKWWVDASF